MREPGVGAVGWKGLGTKVKAKSTHCLPSMCAILRAIGLVQQSARGRAPSAGLGAIDQSRWRSQHLHRGRTVVIRKNLAQVYQVPHIPTA